MKKPLDAEEEENPRPLVFSIPKNPKKEEEEEGEEEGIVNSSSIPSATKISSPKFFNVFQFISSMSSGFDLSSLFESTRQRRGSMFTSSCSAAAIMERMEGFAKGINFRVGRVKDFKMSLTRGTEGRKGRLQLGEPHLSLMEAPIPCARRKSDHQLSPEEELPTTVGLNAESGLGLKGWVNPAWD